MAEVEELSQFLLHPRPETFQQVWHLRFVKYRHEINWTFRPEDEGVVLVISIAATMFVTNNHTPGTEDFCYKAQARSLFAYKDHIPNQRLN